MFVFSDKVYYFADEKQLWVVFFPTFVIRDQIYLKTNTMNTKKILYGFFAFLIIFVSACTSSDTAEEDRLYEVGVDKEKLRIPGTKEGVDRTKLRAPGSTYSVDKTKLKPR